MNSPETDAPGTGFTVDAFWRGAFHLVQPQGRGYRSGLDALLVAGRVQPEWQGRCLDMGSGAGAIGLGAASRAPGLSVVLAENDAGMAACARASLALPQNAAFAGRVSVVEADLLSRRLAREAVGLMDGSFDHILTNPPFYPSAYRASPDASRRAALTMPDPGFMAGWLRTAAALLRHGGQLVMVVRPANLPEVLAAATGRFGGICLTPVHCREGHDAERLIVEATRGSRAALRIGINN